MTSKKIGCFFYASIFVWLFFSFFYYYSITSKNLYIKIENFSSIAQCGIDVGIVFLSFLIYKLQVNLSGRKFFVLNLSFIFLFLTDLAFYIVFYFLQINNPSDLYDSLYTMPFLFFLGLQLYFWFNLVKENIVDKDNFRYILKLFFVLSFLGMIIFIMASSWKIDFFSYLGLYDVITGGIEFLIFDLVILVLICSNNRGTNLLASGSVILIATNFWEKYLFDNKTLNIFDYSDVFWILGLIFIFFGLAFLSFENRKLSSWTSSLKKIKSQFSLWVFSLMTLSFLFLFSIGYFCGLISTTTLMSLPFLIMIYAVAIVLISSYIGTKIESPFEKLKNNIKILTDQEENKISLSNDFSADEFYFLQNFIIDAFEIKNKRVKEKKEMADLAIQVAHDIRSPAAAILMLSKECLDLPEEQRLSLRDAANRIQDIASYLLSKYVDSSDKISEESLVLASTAVLSVLAEKKIQFRELRNIFVFDSTPEANFSFISINATEFKRMISNIINNAIDANLSNKKIAVKVSKIDKYFTICISDQGTGMESELISEIMAGNKIESSKKDGHGLGLSHVRSAIKKYNGELRISSEINFGTKVSMIFNVTSPPVWILDEINFYSDDHILVLDDDTSIHSAWDMIFSLYVSKYVANSSENLKISHFKDSEECSKFINQSTDKTKFLLLADYELLKQKTNGLDVIEFSGVKRAILVTSYFDNIDIIKRAILLNVKILPKLLSAEVKLKMENREHIERDIEEDVNMVLLEDNKEFSDVLSYLYKNRGKKIAVYHDPYVLFKFIENYQKKTKICLDYNLNCPVNGIDMAGVLYRMNYKNLYLATGAPLPEEIVPGYITVLKNKMDLLDL